MQPSESKDFILGSARQKISNQKQTPYRQRKPLFSSDFQGKKGNTLFKVFAYQTLARHAVQLTAFFKNGTRASSMALTRIRPQLRKS
ncbi:hypothetical protein [Ectopseudomonas khazarica]|uniref:hypothetical protein n=1 Tax=Ectopseudomonas khazarica TaxID=2502979 RepID=UPI0037C4FB68